MALFSPFPLSPLFFLLHLLTSFLLTISPHAISVEEKDGRRVLPEGKRRKEEKSLPFWGSHAGGGGDAVLTSFLTPCFLSLSSLNSASRRPPRSGSGKKVSFRTARMVGPSSLLQLKSLLLCSFYTTHLAREDLPGGAIWQWKLKARSFSIIAQFSSYRIRDFAQCKNEKSLNIAAS